MKYFSVTQKVQCVGFMGVYWQKLNIDFMIMFSLVYNKIIYRQPVQKIG